MSIIYDRHQRMIDRENRKIARSRYQVKAPYWQETLLSVHRTKIGAYIAILWHIAVQALDGNAGINIQIIDTKGTDADGS